MWHKFRGTKEYTNKSLWSLILSHPVSPLHPPSFTVTNLLCVVAETFMHIVSCPFVQFTDYCYAFVFHLVMYLGGFSMSADSFFILLNGYTSTCGDGPSYI